MMSNSNPELWDTIFSKRAEVVSREIAGESILVPVRGSLADMKKIFSLNRTGQYIWCHLDGKKQLKDILEELLFEFDTQRKQAKEDILEFITELLKADLIKEPAEQI